MQGSEITILFSRDFNKLKRWLLFVEKSCTFKVSGISFEYFKGISFTKLKILYAKVSDPPYVIFQQNFEVFRNFVQRDFF